MRKDHMPVIRLPKSTTEPTAPNNDWHMIASDRSLRTYATIWFTTIALLCSGAGIASIVDRVGSLSSECASRDSKLLARIKQLEEAGGSAANEAARAVLALVDARKACVDDQARGLTLYDEAVRVLENRSVVSKK